jgi:hypothetical protein
VRDQRGSDLVARAEQIVDRVAVLIKQRGDLGLELGDPAVEVFDVAGKLADGCRGDAFGQAIAEADALEPAQLALAIEVHDRGFGDRVDLGPIGPQALDRLRAVQHETAALQLQDWDRPNQLRLQRRAELGLLAANDAGDR